ncbi:Gfo/Idh/MocA family protein [Flavobacterium cellulosilyticum]|uniref:Gfo/Idh/MocA family oxidoreductase n=1 Tax=Flavobacterium cellulosilyticum TaxID=2541731 RepID=A0A4R5CM23_9FLAO|nr:Gfo/Idh/MocA family oxidoreductase [Flavobacterium cellulosilyticum]TDD99463.1 Gfo/Idh/MocA family oxidoreductase [Flavobacterium cellulosilyticum]
MANSNIVRWGILGCGDVTEVKSGPAYQKTTGFKIEAVMRRNAEKAADYAKRHHISKYYSDADALINDPEIDAIYIATPPDTHHFYGLKVALAGKICCIEKPLAPSYKESFEINEAFSAKNIPLFTAYYRRTLPRFEQIKKWLDTNTIGTVRSIRWNLTKPVSAQDLSGEYNWRTDAKVAPGGYFDDLASHGLDLFNFLLGDIKEVSGYSLNQQGLYSATDATTACWIHENGITGNGNWNFGSNKREDKVEITGTHGVIYFSIFENDPIILLNDEGETELYIEHPENVQLHHVERIRDQLLNNIKHPSNGLTAVHTSWVMDRILGKIEK